MKRFILALTACAALSALGLSAARANEAIEDAWYGEGGAASPYALVSRDVNNDNSYPYTPSPEQWRDRNIYQLFTDRFATDGNNRVQGYRPAWDCEYSGDWNNRSYPFNRNYHHGGNWAGLRQQIPYLKGMGVTAVWISGVQQNDQGVNDSRWTPYHQYHVDNFFRCDPCMGTFQELKDLIDDLHENGIAVILDVAPNHMCDKNGWGSINEDKQFHWDESGQHWWYDDNRHCAPFDNLDRFHVNGTINNWDQSPENLMGQFKGTDDLDQDDPLTSSYLYMAFKNLIDATDCDGFRVDAIKHIPYDWCRNWAQAIRNHAAWRGKSNFLMFGELFSYDTGALASWCRDGYGFNSALLFPLMQAMNGVFGSGQSSYQLGEQMNAIGNYGDGKENVIAFLDNHDVNRFAMAFAPNNREYAKKIMAPAMTFLYLAPPVPLLYYGTEHMFDQGGHGNGSARGGDENPDDSDWQRECMFNRGFQPGNAGGDKFSDQAKEEGLYYHIAWLNGLRNKCRALRRGGFEQRYYSGGQGLYAFTKWYDNEIALVVINTADYEQSADIATGADGDFYENGDGDKYTTSGGKIHVSLAGKGSKVFIRNFVDNSADLGSSGGSSGGGDQLWAANTYGWPIDNATTADTLWVNTEAGPASVAADPSKNFKVWLVYGINTDNPDEWTKVEMELNADWASANGGWYHANLGNLPVGKVEYLVAVDADGMDSYWDHNPETGGNFILNISAAPGVFFQNVSSTPTEPDDGGSVTITATVASDPETDVSGLAATLQYAFSAGGTEGAWTSAAMAKSETVYTNKTDTTTNIWTTFTYTINALPGGQTLLYKVSAANGAETIQANGGNAYSVKITGNVSGLVGNCWHCPTNHEPYEDFCMRLPVTPKGGWTMQLRIGNYQGGEGEDYDNEPYDMTGGTVYYRFGTPDAWGDWQSAPLGWEVRQSHNNFWKGEFEVPAARQGQFLQYYFEVNYEGNTAGLATTYLYMHPDNSGMYLRTTNEKEARASAFEVGIAAASESDEPGYIWHGGNTTRSAENAVQVWANIGYIGSDGVAWADEAVIRYRIDLKKEGRSRSAGVKAIRSSKARAARSWAALTNEVPMTFQSTVADASGKQVMVWMGSIVDDRLLDENSVLIYEVYARNTKGNGNWKQAEYNKGDGSCTFEYRMWSDGSGDLTVDGVPADYTTSKFFIDEAAGDEVSVLVAYHAPDDAEAVELFTNFGRRDYADVDTDNDGWPDGMIPPDGSKITAENCADGYWQAIPMKKGSGAFVRTLTTGKCGVYRITARYRAKGATQWTWYSDNPDGANRRDHVVVISPKKAMEQTMYELNVLTTKATGTSAETSGNFEGLSERLTATAADPFGEFSIDYLNRMGINCLWFQPIHPNLDYKRGNTNSAGTQYKPGSPYATKNYFSVNPQMSSSKTEAGAVAAFTNFVRLCDHATTGTPLADAAESVGTINVMLDGVLNHTSFDAVFGEGLALATNGLGAAALAEIDAAAPGWRSIKATDTIPATKLGIQWYSHVVDETHDQSAPASRYVSVDDNDIANAPERYDFGKWNDVAELLYGNYSTMVRYDDMEEKWYQGDDGNWYSYWELGPETSRVYSEEDSYYYGEMLPATKLLWKYMASYPEYWIKKTGNDGVNHPGERDSDGVLTDDYGIDGLRCDYAQGLPNQFWEYTVNRTRSMKWNFLFMAESLDGGKVGFRSNRQFDILNENMVFRFTQDHVSNPAQLQAELENRRAAYGNGLILLNLTCHDEVMPWGDPQATASRYAMVAAFDGVPMIFYGQEQAISTFDLNEGHDPDTGNKWVGFNKFEQNFGKWIPHFKTWNRMLVWDEPVYPAGEPNDSRAIAQFYGRVNLARQKSPALRSQNRWFLNDNDKIMFCAKWEDPGKSPNEQDAVFAAVLFLNDFAANGKDGHAGSGAVYDISPFASYMGIENRADRLYNLVNIASSSDEYVWDEPKSGAELYEKGLGVSFTGSKVGTNGVAAAEWGDNGAVVQFLKVRDVTGEVPPVAPDGLTITDPAEASIEVAAGTASYDVIVMAGKNMDGDVTWVNEANGATGTHAAETIWTNPVSLLVGANKITFTGTTKGGSSESTFSVLASVSGTNSVAGFEDFVDASSDKNNAGWFVHTDVGATGLTGFTGNAAYGMWANLGYNSEAKRVFTKPAGATLKSVSVDVGMRWDSDVEGSYKGIEFMDSANNPVFGVQMSNTATVAYYGAGGNGTWSEAYGEQVFNVTLTRTSTGYTVSGTTRDGGTFAGLQIATTAEIVSFKAYMNGVKEEWSDEAQMNLKDNRQLYFDNISYTVAGEAVEPETVTATVTITVKESGGDVEEPVTITGTPVVSYDPATRKLSLKLDCDTAATVSSVPVYMATELVGRNWNWTQTGTATVASDGSVTFDLDDIPAGVTVISVGTPPNVD